LDSQGEILIGETNLTDNDGWQDGTKLNLPRYSSPSIVPLSDENFVVAWVDQRKTSQGETSNLYYAVYSRDGMEVSAPTKLTNSSPDQTSFGDPMLVQLNSNQALLAYSLFEYETSSYSIGYGVLNSSCRILMDGDRTAPSHPTVGLF